LVSENGHKYIKMHIDGKDFRNCSSGFIQSFQERVSRVLMIPQRFVCIVGVEPSSSLLITIMIPEEYAELMLEMLLRGDAFPELQEDGVDLIVIDGARFNITGTFKMILFQRSLSNSNHNIRKPYNYRKLC